MLNTVYTVLAFLPVVGYYLYVQLLRWRSKYKDIPQLPNSLLMGHLPYIASGFKKLGDARRHMDYIFASMVEEAGSPDLLLVDTRPAIGFAVVIVASHTAAEQMSRTSKSFPTSVNKSPTNFDFTRLFGYESIIAQEGDKWKSLRKRFNPGFAPQHLTTLLPAIVGKASDFMEKLDSFVRSGAEFALEPLCTNFTFDVIGAVTMNLNFDAQNESRGHPIVYHTRKILHTFANTSRPSFIPSWVNVPLMATRIYHSNKADAVIKKCIQEKFDEIKASQRGEARQFHDRSVLALALKDVDQLSSETLQSTADQIKSFLFAGHDTTSILLQWIYYALSIHPKCLETIRAEHEAVFGDKDPREVYLAKPDETTKALSYTSACIKEALRLWPPAASARMAPVGSGFKVRLEDGREVCVDGTVLYINHFIIQRDPKVYGETANDFVPERWLGDSDTTSARKDDVWDSKQAGDNEVPITAWRPFERGPRNCIGQELANLEARVILSCTVRKYDFTKVGAGEVELNEKGEPTVDERGKYKLKSELFNAPVITSKPFDQCMMKVKFCDLED